MRRAIAVSMLVLSACATSSGFQRVMNSYVGGPESRLVGDQGPPSSVYRSDDGAKILTFVRNGQMMLAGYAGAPPTAVPLTCTVNFTIDSSGTVVRWTSTGNHCVA